MSKSITSETPLPLPIPASDELGPLVGRTFGGYEITSYIGEGPTGAVYRAEDLVGSRMAVKVMHKELSTKPAADKLWADLQKLTALRLPSMVKVYDAGFDDEGQFYYTMDELIGCDLEAGLEESGALAPSKALEIVRQICAVLEATHAIGIVHGGLKPRNVFLAPTAQGLVVKVLDFGAGRLAGGVDKGVIVGNPFYMAPEQFGGTADARTDIYSLGVLMYELFSGTLPFAGPSHGQVMMRHLAEVPQPPPGVDDELGRIILRALVKNPAGRYGTLRHLLAAIDRWAASSPSLLQDAAAFAVIARAEEARVMKQAALSAPDATSPMPKLDLAELARGTRDRADTPPVPGVSVAGGKNDKPQNNGENNNSSESVEASLEDFISQANASFPTGGAVTADGWDLHTGDVELVDEAEDQLESEEHVAAPAAPATIKAKGDSQKGKAPKRETKPMKAVAAPIVVEEASAPIKKSRTGSMPAVQAHHTPPRVQVAEALDESGPEPEPLDPPPSAPRRKVERTEVVSSPIPISSGSNVPWTANPLVIIGGLLAAFIIGAGLVFLMVRTMMPTQQPVVVQSPPQIVVQPPAPVPTQPVVTPLPQNPVVAAPAPAPAPQVAGQPVVTPLPQAAVPAPAPAPQAVVPAPQAAAPQAAPAEPVKRAPIRRAVAAPKKKAAPVDAEPAEKPEKPAKAAAAPKAEKPAKAAKPDKGDKSEKKGSDWVDPFAQ